MEYDWREQNPNKSGQPGMAFYERPQYRVLRMNAGERLRSTYRFSPVDHLVRREFYIWEEAIEKWKKEGLPPMAFR